MKKGNLFSGIILVALLVVILGGLFYVFRNYEHNLTSNKSRVDQQTNKALWILDTSKPEVKKYKNQEVGYEIEIPASWSANLDLNKNLLNQPHALDNVSFFRGTTFDDLSKSEDPGNPMMGIFTISNPSVILPKDAYVSVYGRGLSGLEEGARNNSGSTLVNIEHITIDSHNALVVKTKNAVNQPSGMSNAWCGECNIKNIYIDAGQGKILVITGTWGKDRTDVEGAFDRLFSTFHFSSR